MGSEVGPRTVVVLARGGAHDRGLVNATTVARFAAAINSFKIAIVQRGASR